MFKVFNFHRHLVRQLGTQLAHDFFTNQLGCQEAAGTVSNLVFRIKVFIFRQTLTDGAPACPDFAGARQKPNTSPAAAFR